MITDNLRKILDSLPDGVQLIAVSKTKPVEDLMQVYHAGHKIFGENKVQEMCDKQAQMPADVQWHMIGHLQTNKVKNIAPFVRLIHSVDSLKLLKEINKEAFKNHRVIDCLLQFHIAREETKFGFDMEEALEMLHSPEYASLQNIRIVGVMGMATFTENITQIHQEFATLRTYFQKLKSTFFAQQENFKEISMGMSDDYTIAIQEGSTMVRVGSAIFSMRKYV